MNEAFPNTFYCGIPHHSGVFQDVLCLQSEAVSINMLPMRSGIVTLSL